MDGPPMIPPEKTTGGPPVPRGLEPVPALVPAHRELRPI